MQDYGLIKDWDNYGSYAGQPRLKDINSCTIPKKTRFLFFLLKCQDEDAAAHAADSATGAAPEAAEVDLALGTIILNKVLLS